MSVELLYKKYYKELVHWIQSMSKNLQLAEEIVQDAFLKALDNEDLISTLGEKQCRAWMYRTAKNIFIDKTRRQNFETTINEFYESEEVSQELSDKEWEIMLNDLPDTEGVLFYMRYVEGYTSAQLGKIFCMPSGTVRYKLSQARKHLKKLLGGIENA